MDPDELASITVIDLTTIGRRSGRPHRLEIWWFRVDGRFVITGTPGRRDWFANVVADPGVTVHVGGHDLDARALPVTDPVFRRRVFEGHEARWYRTQAELDVLVDTAPMVEVIFLP